VKKISSNKKFPPPFKPTAVPQDLAALLQRKFNEKWPHLADREDQVRQAQKERAGLKDKDLH
jgi:hypothetical protein